MCVIELSKIAEFVGPFETEAAAYAYAARFYGELNGDEFLVWALNPPMEVEQ